MKQEIKIPNREQRTFRADMTIGEEGKTVVGYAAVFNSLSEEMWGFREQIDPAAFNDADMSDTRALFNHDPNLLLARSSSGTLKLEIDQRGLKYSFELPDTTVGRDLREMLKRGDISQSSFGFTIAEDEWNEKKNENGEVIEATRTIKKINRLYDVSPVTYPAYTDASVALRSMENWKETHKAEKPEPINTPFLDIAEGMLM